MSPDRAGLCRAVPNCCRLQPVTAASPRGHICTCTSAPAPALESKQSLSQQHQHLPPLRLSPAAGRGFVHPLTLLGQRSAQCPSQLMPEGRRAVHSGPPLRDFWGQQLHSRFFQNEDLQSLIIHPQPMEALCPDKQTSTVASVQPAAGLALIQARGKAFCLN